MRHLTTFLLVCCLLVSGAISYHDTRDTVATPAQSSNKPRTSIQPVMRGILAETNDPPGAPGRRLSLVLYTIAPDAVLVPHVHPGLQMASVVSGTLTYRVLSRTVTVRRAVNRDGGSRYTEVLVGPTETRLGPGDAVIEGDDMIHFGANRTAQPVVILATLITEPDQPLAVRVDTVRR